MKKDDVVDKDEFVLFDLSNPDVSVDGLAGGGKSTYKIRTEYKGYSEFMVEGQFHKIHKY